MTIITLTPLKKFMVAHPDARPFLNHWIATVKDANWSNPNELKSVYPSASLVANDRVVFNVGGNKYRLVVFVIYPVRTLFVRFIGTHRGYDLIDVATI